MKKFSSPRLLLLYANYIDSVSYYDDWQDAFTESELFHTTALNICDLTNYNLIRSDLNNYDAIVILHSANANGPHYLEPYKWLFQKRKCRLFSFVGNELNYPNPGAGMRHKLKFLSQIEPEAIASQLPLESAIRLYEDLSNTRIFSVPHALNPKAFYPTLPNEQRKTDIGQRSAKYYPLLGDNERERILSFFENHKAAGLTIDVSVDDQQRLNRKDWAGFLNRCKGTVATEAGTYFLEKDDATVLKIDHYIHRKLGIKKINKPLSVRLLSLLYQVIPYYQRQQLKSLLPAGEKNTILPPKNEKVSESIYYSVSFEELFEKFFINYTKRLSGKCISSRHFDAIGTQTCQIMFPGYFNGILKADDHYIPLNRDFSDIHSVLQKFSDTGYRTQLVKNTLTYVLDCHTYTHRINEFNKILNELS